MKAICIIKDGIVDDVIVCNDDEEQRMIEALADANDKLDPDDRVHIRSLTPSKFEAVLDYVSTL